MAPLAQAGAAIARSNWTQGRTPPLANVFYVGALANNLAGVDLNSDSVDILAEFNSDVDTSSVFGEIGFYYGTGPNTGSNIDFFPVVLHELGHGLGFSGFFRPDGSLRNGAPMSFDRLMADGFSATAQPILNYSALERSTFFRSNNLYFSGPRARAAGGGRNAKLYAPPNFDEGSSLYHTDEATYSGVEELMTPLATSEPRDAGPVTFAMFLDIGWGEVGGATPSPTATPNPVATPISTPIASRPPNDDFERAQVLGGASGASRATTPTARARVESLATRTTAAVLRSGTAGRLRPAARSRSRRRDQDWTRCSRPTPELP
jgi:hypothetical protein